MHSSCASLEWKVLKGVRSVRGALRNIPGCLLGLQEQWAQLGLEQAQCRGHVAQQDLPLLLPAPSPLPGWGCQGRAGES